MRNETTKGTETMTEIKCNTNYRVTEPIYHEVISVSGRATHEGYLRPGTIVKRRKQADGMFSPWTGNLTGIRASSGQCFRVMRWSGGEEDGRAIVSLFDYSDKLEEIAE